MREGMRRERSAHVKFRMLPVMLAAARRPLMNLVQGLNRFLSLAKQDCFWCSETSKSDSRPARILHSYLP